MHKNVIIRRPVVLPYQIYASTIVPICIMNQSDCDWGLLDSANEQAEFHANVLDHHGSHRLLVTDNNTKTVCPGRKSARAIRKFDDQVLDPLERNGLFGGIGGMDERRLSGQLH